MINFEWSQIIHNPGVVKFFFSSNLPPPMSGRPSVNNSMYDSNRTMLYKSQNTTHKFILDNIPGNGNKVRWNYLKQNLLQKKDKEELTVSEITAPMGGKVLDIKVNPGDTVNQDDEVIVLEAMKMELPVVASESGTVKEVKCKKGDTVEADAVLIVLG
jgi:acetyl-CoA carboxylase biotin carboxyl carrier protein